MPMQLCDQWLKQYYGKLDYRDFTLLDRAVRTLLSNIAPLRQNPPLPWAPFRGIMPSHVGFAGVWNWDTAFHAIGVARWDVELAQEQIRMFLALQQENGLLPDVLFEDGRLVKEFGKPPVMPWAAMVVDQYRHDSDFVRQVYPAFDQYLNFWMVERGGREHGLFHYDSSATDPDQRREGARYESGWDNAIRWDNGIFEVWPVDLNCFMLMSYRAMAYFADELALAAEAAQWRRRSDELSATIEAKLWDSQTGAYLDYDFGTGKFVLALSPASFMPLYVGIAAKDHAAAMATMAANPHQFYPGWPTVSYDHPQFDPEGYWRGRTWLNVAYFALKGLKNNGYDEIAETGRQTILGWVENHPEAIYENYHSVNGKALGAPHFSWSSVFVMEFLLNWEIEKP